MSSPFADKIWMHRTTGARMGAWIGWLALLSLFVFCWQIMTADTIWSFVTDATSGR